MVNREGKPFLGADQGLVGDELGGAATHPCHFHDRGLADVGGGCQLQVRHAAVFSVTCSDTTTVTPHSDGLTADTGFPSRYAPPVSLRAGTRLSTSRPGASGSRRFTISGTGAQRQERRSDGVQVGASGRDGEDPGGNGKA